ncbi:uncharacterized protein LOC141686004 [Apium graveolens]|uniref:uncharacterized protein LOC141686004 n=1 Tax=Apium graveolens TaxID=4045 RepID=UPI003D7AFFAC
MLLVLYQNFAIATCKLVPYPKECASVVPEATPTSKMYVAFPYLRKSNTYVTGGERIFGKDSSDMSMSLYISSYVFATKIIGVYKIEAELTFRGYNLYNPQRYSTHHHTRLGILKFALQGFWSDFSGEGCVVGSASWHSKGEPLNLEAMLKIKYSRSSAYSNSSVTGKLESLSSLNDERYFEPIFILSFPPASEYEYKLISEETVRDFDIVNDEKSSILGFQPGDICSLFGLRYITFKLDYASGCNGPLKNCSLLDGNLQYMPPYISLHAIQCHRFEKKMRFLVRLTNKSFIRSEMFHPNTTLVGEGSWNEKTNRLLIVACRISNSNKFGSAHVGDCSFRLSLWYPSVWSIRNRNKAMGQIWTNKTAEDKRHFRMIKFRTSDEYVNVPGLKYEYTQIEKVRKLCPKTVVKRGERYPSEQSYDLRFDMSVPNSKKIEFELGGNYAVPRDIPLNVSYKLSFSTVSDVKLEAVHSSLDQSLDPEGQLQISAEGVYDARTGLLCMVGCRVLDSYDSLDCGILLKFQFPGLNVSNGGFIKGSMKSTREHTDPLFFEHLKLISTSFSGFEEERTLWRIDLEIIMVLISNTVACVFVCFQLYYVKKYPSSLAYMSLMMLVILTLGKNTMPGSPEWFEVSKVFARVVTLVAFLLQFRLLQLAWTARHSSQSNGGNISIAEKKTLLVCLPTYIIGGLVALIVNRKKNDYGNPSQGLDFWEKHTLWGNLRSCAGLILDGFLYPQVLLYIFQVPSERALSSTFYLGTTLVHSVPHVYDLYRANNYIPVHVKGANQSADFYSASWDIIIPAAGFLCVYGTLD